VREKEIDLINVVIHDPDAFSGSKLGLILAEVDKLHPEYCQNITPALIHVAVRNSPDNQYHVSRFIERLGQLLRRDDQFAGVQIGQETGKTLCTIDIFGRLKSVTIGKTAYMAIRSAI
jgi:hypothetical protein